MVFFWQSMRTAMRACFLGQNVCALGYGVAVVQTLPAGPEGAKPAAEQGPPPAPLPNRMFEGLRKQFSNVNGRQLSPIRS
jgi:hypothetical protein